MIDLKNTTFIIPLMIESQDRYNNAVSVLGFLNHHFETNIIIHELITKTTKLDFISTLNNLKIKHITEKFSGQYHRTRQLNEMLDITNTPVVVNYDIDVLLPVESYVEAQDRILDETYDVVYPYEESINGQVRIMKDFNRDIFNKTFDLNLIKSYDLWTTKCGHCMFLNTKKYIECGGENENFIAYGPEDSERYERFHKIDYKVGRVGNLVFHFEHSRTQNSNNDNVYFNNNNQLYLNIRDMNKESVISHYKNIKYKDKYKNFK
tara:strand:+ start:3135 stop:3926 length:792 start_codon:yes stop_codon:yes gene_type:complete